MPETVTAQPQPDHPPQLPAARCTNARQMQPPGDRQARRMIGQRQADRHLAVVLFAELAAILTRHPHRMAAFLRKAGVVDDPGFDRAVAFDDRHGQLLDSAENPLVRPRRWRRNAAATGAWPRPGPVPLPPRSARRSYGLPAAASLGNNHAMARPDPHAQSPRRVPRHRPRTVPAGPRSCPVSPRKCSLRVARTVTP